MSFMFAVVITLLLTTFNINKAFDIIERRGPEFLEEPQNIVSFLNDTGSLITCRAKGTPQPAIKWTKLDGSPLLAVPGLRQFRNDGQMIQLVYMPFAANDYRQDIHSVSVRCVASNSIGSIESRDSHIRASVKQSYEVQVYDDFVIKGNTGILRCHIPSFVREYVAVTNWQSSDGIKIYSNLVNGGRFSVMPTGELHIHGVDSVSDSQKQYRCQTKHKLSGEVKLSANSGRLIVTESHSNMPPKIITTSRYIVGMIGETIELACSTQAYPRPEFSWFKINARSNNKELKSIVSSPVSSISSASKLLQFDDSLIIRDATVEDSAKYICTANNSVGRDRLEIQLLVRAPLNVILTPSHILVSDSDSVTFNCSVFGHPIENIIWKKNAKSILLNNRIKLISDRSLHISRIKREDRGMYQCIASNEFESFVSSAELTLSDDPPIFTHVFKQSEPYRPGHGLSLKCSATGLPLPQIVWTLDGSSMRENLRLRIGDYVSSDGNVNSYVNISSLRTEDGGTYSCIASNDVHSVIHSDRINVYGLPFVRQMSNVTAIAGQTVVIHCPAAGYPLESIEWYKKSSGKLPQNHRQTCLPNGTLIIEKIDRQNDEEMYSCVVNASSASASSDVYIKVLIAPVINPFSQPPNLREGMRGMLTCSVVEGDAPIVIEFLKDGMPLKTTRDGNIKIDASNEFSLTLLILKVSSEHSGNYTCVASNLAAKTSYSIQMIVNVPPKWIIPPANTEAIVGQNLIIDCLASGQPRVWWERSNVNSGIDLASKSRLQQYRSIISNSHMHTLENGSLTIREVSEEDSGEYLCQANNGVGPGLSKVIALKVHVAAHFKTKFSSQTVKRDQQILIICDSFGEIPISIILSKDRMQFDASLEPRYEIIKNERIDGFSLTLKIANCDRRDSALFTCIAANSYGKDEYNVQVLVEEPPDRPENVLISQIESRSAVLSWISAYSGNSAITSYEIEYKVLGTDWGNSEKIKHTVIGIANSLTIRGIKPINDYQIRIRAENKLGFSDWSQSIQFKTTEEAPSSPPLNIQVFPLSARSLQITWSAPNVELRNGRILGYYLGYKVQASDSQYIFKTLTTGDTISDNSNQLNEVKLTELKRSTKYTIIVQAFNSKGSGPQSTEVIGETLENDPPKAPILSLEEARHNSIKLNWKIDDIEDLLSVISGFYIYSKHQHSEWEERHLNAPINSYTFTDLLCGTQYQFYIVAYNSVGKGDPSQAIAVKTKGSVALPPQRTNALIVVNTSSAILKLDSWITNGCDIKYFIIKYKSKYDKDWSIVSNEVLSQQRFIELIDLMPANWYDINVIAVTDAGNTEQRYNFATLTPNGATVSPLDMSQSISYNSSILIPIICSVIVLTVILIIACFVITRRRQLFSLDNNSVHNCLDAHHVNNADSFHLSVLEPNKEINCSDANCVNSATKSSYFPTSYAMSSVQRKSMCCAESELSSLNSLRHNRHEQHVYDVPFPPKWV